MEENKYDIILNINNSPADDSEEALDDKADEETSEYDELEELSENELVETELTDENSLENASSEDSSEEENLLEESSEEEAGEEDSSEDSSEEEPVKTQVLEFKSAKQLEDEENKKRFLEALKEYKGLFIGFVVAVIVNIFAWLAPVISKVTGLPNWCDLYAKHINPILVTVFSRIMNIFPFSVGEILLVLAAVLVLVFLISSIIFIWARKKEKYRTYYKNLLDAVVIITVLVVWIMTLNCSIYYHTTPMDGNLKADAREYNVDDLEKLRNYIVEKCNEYSKVVKRDDDGNVLYDVDFNEESKKALYKLVDTYPRMSGYYPGVKPMMFSWAMTQMYMCGYYFPFSMEANVNKYMYDTNNPSTYCHELAHLHGYIYEDEANFIGFLACISSDNVEYQYSGYLSVLYYVDNLFYNNASFEQIEKAPFIDEQVYIDNEFVPQEIFDKIEDSSPVDTEVMEEVTDDLTDISLNLNGVKDGILSYDRVTDLLFQYYDGILY